MAHMQLSMPMSYGDLEYWDRRGRMDLGSSLQEANVDWYADFETLKPVLTQHIQYSDAILIIGAGSSLLHEQLYDSGYRGITCIDFSGHRIGQMQARDAKSRASLHFNCADILEGIKFQHYGYSFVVDKGTLDCILCRENGAQEAEQALRHVYDAMKLVGTCIVVSHSPPSQRMQLINTCPWKSVQVKAIKSTPLSHCVDEALPSSDVIVDLGSADEYPDAAAYIYIMKKSAKHSA